MGSVLEVFRGGVYGIPGIVLPNSYVGASKINLAMGIVGQENIPTAISIASAAISDARTGTTTFNVPQYFHIAARPSLGTESSGQGRTNAATGGASRTGGKSIG